MSNELLGPAVAFFMGLFVVATVLFVFGDHARDKLIKDFEDKKFLEDSSKGAQTS